MPFASAVLFGLCTASSLGSVAVFAVGLVQYVVDFSPLGQFCVEILSNNDGDGLDGRTMVVLSAISEPGETLSRGQWCYVLTKCWKMVVAAFVFWIA